MGLMFVAPAVEAAAEGVPAAIEYLGGLLSPEAAVTGAGLGTTLASKKEGNGKMESEGALNPAKTGGEGSLEGWRKDPNRVSATLGFAKPLVPQQSVGEGQTFTQNILPAKYADLIDTNIGAFQDATKKAVDQAEGIVPEVLQNYEGTINPTEASANIQYDVGTGGVYTGEQYWQTAERNARDAQDKYNDIMEEYENAEIDPERYVKNLGLGKSTMAALGMLVSGVGSGLSHQENLAMKMFNQNIERDIAAQAKKLETLHNAALTRHGYVQTKQQQVRDATAIRDIAVSQLDKAVKTFGELLQAKNAKTSTPLDMKLLTRGMMKELIDPALNAAQAQKGVLNTYKDTNKASPIAAMGEDPKVDVPENMQPTAHATIGEVVKKATEDIKNSTFGNKPKPTASDWVSALSGVLGIPLSSLSGGSSLKDLFSKTTEEAPVKLTPDERKLVTDLKADHKDLTQDEINDILARNRKGKPWVVSKDKKLQSKAKEYNKGND
jgi:hypothetical protein